MDIKAMMQQAQQMQKKMEAMQEEQKNKTYEGKSGGGLVTLTLLGTGALQDIKIDADLLKAEEQETLQDLIVAAFNNALANKAENDEDAMQGLLPPGMKLPF